MIGSISITPKHPNQPLHVISVGRLSQPKETEAETQQSLEAIRHENERMLASIYSGPMQIEYLAEQTSGLLAERQTMVDLWKLVATGEWDLIVAEDLSRIFRNPGLQWQFVYGTVDAGIRLICFADNLDTSDENWETSVAVATLRHGLVIPDTRRRISRTATETFHRGGQVGKVRAGYARVSKEDAAEGTYGPKGLRMRRLPEFKEVLQEIRRRFEAGHSPRSVVAWMNAASVPTGPYVKSGRWTVKQLLDLLQDPVVHGTRVFRKVLHRQIYRTGKYRREPNSTPETEHFPELAHLTREQQEELLALVGWRIDWGAATPPATPHPRKGIARSQSFWPGQSAICAACDGVMYVVGDCLRCKNSRVAVDQTCWNHVEAPIAELRAFVTDWLVQQFKTSAEFRNILLPIVQEQLRQRVTHRSVDRDRQAAEIAALAIREGNLRKSIGIAERLTDAQLESLVGDLANVTALLAKKRRQAQSTDTSIEPLGEVGGEEVGQRLPEALAYLLETSYDMAEVVRGFVPRCVIVPVQAIDSGQVHARAKLCIRGLGSASNGEDVNTVEELIVDLFKLPVHLRLLPEVVRLRSQYPESSLRQLGPMLGTSYMTIKRALAVARQMEAQGLSEPLIELTSKPTYASRWKDAS